MKQSMNRQMIITIGREYGSAGHEIGEILAQKFALPLYDNNLLTEIASEKQLNESALQRYDERPKNYFLHRKVQGFSNSPEENIAHLQFRYLREKAQNGESFVIIGRCAEEVLKEFPCVVTVFVLGDRESKLKRIMNKFQVSRSEAETMLQKNDKKRKEYHNYHCKGKWGDSRNYELSVNSSRLGVEKTAALIEDYIRARFADPV